MEEEQKKSNAWVWIVVVVIALAMLVPALKLMKKANTTDVNMQKDDYSAFNSDSGQAPVKGQVPESAPALFDAGLHVRYVTKGQQADAQQQAQQQREAEKQEEARQAADRAAGVKPPKKTTERELQILRRHDKQLREYQAYLSSIGQKYYKRYPAIRQMDAEFSGMGRFMALKQQYARDRDAFKWARGVMGLPEVRDALIRYSANPQVLKAMVEVSLEALRHPPPKAVTDEMFKFFINDDRGSQFLIDMSGQPMRNAMKNIDKVVSPDTDLAPLENLGQDLIDGIREQTKR